MIRCRTIKDFSLVDYKKLKNIKRINYSKEGFLYTGDEFECEENMAKYLLGGNDKKEKVIEVLEITPKKKGKK